MNFSRSHTCVINPVANRFLAAALATFAALILSVFGSSQWASADGSSTGPDTDPSPASTPGAPRHVTALPGDESAAVTWFKPAVGETEIAEIDGYVITENPSGISVVTPANDMLVIVEGLENGIEYTFTVVASNADGAGEISEPSRLPLKKVSSSTSNASSDSVLNLPSVHTRQENEFEKPLNVPESIYSEPGSALVRGFKSRLSTLTNTLPKRPKKPTNKTLDRPSMQTTGLTG